MADSPAASALADYRALAATQVRSEFQYRVSFFAMLALSGLITFFDFVGIAALFVKVPSLGGWSIGEVAFLYATSSLSYGIADLLVGSVERIGPRVKEGTLDNMLLRPVNVLVHLAAAEFSFRRLGRIIQGAAVFVFVLTRVEIDWTPLRLLALVTAVISGAVIAMTVWVATSSIAFWTVNAGEFGNAFTYGSQTAVSYPLHVLESWLRLFLTYVVPVAFVNYVPALYILDAPSPVSYPRHLWALSPVVALVMCAVATFVWRAGLARYQSTGS